jgi:hypothetical protein
MFYPRLSDIASAMNARFKTNTEPTYIEAAHERFLTESMAEKPVRQCFACSHDIGPQSSLWRWTGHDREHGDRAGARHVYMHGTCFSEFIEKAFNDYYENVHHIESAAS